MLPGIRPQLGFFNRQPVSLINRSAYTQQNPGSSTVTFSSQAIGTASATRRVFVAVNTRETTDHTITSATIGGVAATIHIQENTTSSSTESAAAIISATVPTGTTANVVLVYPGSPSAVGIVCIAVDHLQSPTAVNTYSDTTLASGALSRTTVSWVAGGFVLAVATYNTTATVTHTWAGVTERWDDDLDGDTISASTGGDLFPISGATGQTVSVTPSNTSPDNGVLVVATFN